MESTFHFNLIYRSNGHHPLLLASSLRFDTAQPSSGDIFEPSDQPRIKESFYRVSSHSVVVFESR